MCQAVNKLTCVSLWQQSAYRHIQQVYASFPWLSDNVVGDLVLGTRAERGCCASQQPALLPAAITQIARGHGCPTSSVSSNQLAAGNLV